MDVHHHSHGGKKGFGGYFLEFFMLFLAVTLGFFAENIREDITEHKRENAYMKSLVQDLEEDTASINLYKKINLKMSHGQDSLIEVMSSYKDADTTDQHCYRYYFFYTTRFAEVVFNDRTMSQLLNGGNMRLIEKQNVSDSIMDYSAIIKYVKSQSDAYREYFMKTLDMSMGIFNMSYARSTMDSTYHLHATGSFGKGQMKLLTKDPAVFAKYVNTLSLSKSILQGYILNLNVAGEKATTLIQVLQKEYHIKDEKDKP